MRRPLDRPLKAVAAVRPRVARSLLVALALLTLAAAIAAFVFARKATSRHAAAPKSAAAIVASADRSSAPWLLSVPMPLQVGNVTNPRAKAKAVSPEPDWSALSLGVSSAEAAPAPLNSSLDASSPAELRIALSREERSRLIAAARDAEEGTAPAGYRPAIGQLYPAGGGDGICR
jgi:hypothetical protein